MLRCHAMPCHAMRCQPNKHACPARRFLPTPLPPHASIPRERRKGQKSPIPRFTAPNSAYQHQDAHFHLFSPRYQGSRQDIPLLAPPGTKRSSKQTNKPNPTIPNTSAPRPLRVARVQARRERDRVRSDSSPCTLR